MIVDSKKKSAYGISCCLSSDELRGEALKWLWIEQFPHGTVCTHECRHEAYFKCICMVR